MNRTVLKYRTLVRNLTLDILSLCSKPAPGIHILNGHFLSLNDDAYPELFENLIIKLEKSGIKFINFEEAVRLIESKEIPKNDCLVAFSWDDGFEECFSKIKPVLDRHGIKAAFFINPNFINGDSNYCHNFTHNVVYVNKPPMTWTQIETLKNEGHTIGAHTMDHASLQTDDINVLNAQIVECKLYLQNKLGVEIEYFAFPFGQFSYISSLGIEVALNTYRYVFSQSNYRHYYSCDGRVINRRHFECSWPYKHIVYFLKRKSF